MAPEPGMESTRPKISIASRVDRAFEIFADRKAKQYADRRRKRNGHQQPDEPEQVAERDQGKHHPDRMQPNLGADELGRKHIAFKRLTNQEHAAHHGNRYPVRPE